MEQDEKDNGGGMNLHMTRCEMKGTLELVGWVQKTGCPLQLWVQAGEGGLAALTLDGSNQAGCLVLWCGGLDLTTVPAHRVCTAYSGTRGLRARPTLSAR